MQHNDNPSTSTSNGSMLKEHGSRVAGTEEASPWMVQPHAGTETTVESSTEELCRRELDNYLDYIWRHVAHEPQVYIEQ